MTDLLGPASSGAVTSRPADGRTFGSADTWFQDCTSAAAGDGTDILSAWLNAMLANLRGAIRGMGISETANGDALLRDALFAARLRRVAAGGSANALTAVFSPPFKALSATVSFLVSSATANAAGNMTINVDSLGAKRIYLDGANPPAGLFGPGKYVLLTYDDGAFHVVGSPAAASSDDSAYVTYPVARARLPIFPEVLTSTRAFGVLAPEAGTVRLPAGVSWLHRGIYELTSELTDFATAASKTYHLRWRASSGWALRDLSASDYNGAGRAETDAYFDSDFDDMLVARVVTDASNVATITNLRNSNRLSDRKEINLEVANALNWTALSNSGMTLSWARTPMIAEAVMQTIKHQEDDVNGVPSSTAGAGSLKMMAVRRGTVSRYGCGNVDYAYNDTADNLGHLTFVWTCGAF